MPVVRYQGKSYSIESDQSVLDALLNAGEDVPHSCRSGVCQTCLMQATEGDVPTAAQAGLKETLKAQDYFLACACRPEGDLTARLPGASEVRVRARVEAVEPLNPSVVRLRLSPQEPLDYRAGQYLSLYREDGLARSYSLASLPEADDGLELHIKRIPDGRMSNWLHELAPGTEIDLQGPAGDCFYLPGQPEQNLLLVGTGTGLAPLYGVARDALLQGHQGDIHLFHGALEADQLYLVAELRALANRHANFHYHPCVLNGAPPAGGSQGAVDALALKVAPSLKGWRVYLCGDPELVNKLRKRAFLAGAGMKEIHADAFLTTADAPGNAA